MISPTVFIDWLTELGVRNYVGVPDSVLKSLTLAIDFNPNVDHHLVAANEGSAIGFALGQYLESARPAAVYLQNSGLGNALNPLTALAHRGIYGTPMLMTIGWRGEPGKADEPQHLVQGKITRELLDLMDIPFLVLGNAEEHARKQVEYLLQLAQDSPGPVAILVPSDTFDELLDVRSQDESETLTREGALYEVISGIPPGDRVIVTTGMLGRELWDLRNKKGQSGDHDFLVVGGMGHASAIAHGVAVANPTATVWCLDGDGSLIMHLGTMAVIGNRQPQNLKHILFNNLSHDSVGGQATAATTIDIEGLCQSLGYKWGGSASERHEVAGLVQSIRDRKGPIMLELRVKKGARADLGRPPLSTFIAGRHFPIEA